MERLSGKAKKEFKELANSAALRMDFERMRKNRHDPFVVNGKVDADKVIEFLTEFNAFIGHAPKPFRQITDREMKL